MSTSEPDAPLLLDHLVALALAPFSESFGARLKISGGPVVRFAPSAAIPLALCLHERATNAVKHGALSVHDGQVECGWSERTPGAYALCWAEAGGPKVEKQRSAGFGSRMIAAALNGVPSGGAVLKFNPDGVQCELAFNDYQPDASPR